MIGQVSFFLYDFCLMEKRNNLMKTVQGAVEYRSGISTAEQIAFLQRKMKSTGAQVRAFLRDF
jgi:hypothetical protein